MRLHSVKPEFLEKTIEKILAKYLISKDVNHRQKLIHIIYKASKNYIGQDQLNTILTSFIERLNVISESDAEILTILGFLNRLKLDFAAAIPLLKQAIELKDANAMFLMAYIQMQGLDGKKDPFQARINFEKAARLDHAFAINSLGVLHMDDNLYKDACRLYFKSAILGCHLAQENIHDYISTLIKSTPKQSPSFFPAIASQNLGTKKSMDFIVPSYDDLTLVSFQLDFPPCCEELSTTLQDVFLIAVDTQVRHLFTEHMNHYHKTLKSDESKAKLIRANFDTNKQQLVQNILDELWKTYFNVYFSTPLKQPQPITPTSDQELSGFTL